MNYKDGLLPALLLSVIAHGAVAVEQAKVGRTASDNNAETLPSVEVEESVEKAATFSGSTSVINKQTLERDQVFTVNEALRKAPGVYVRDEEGFGIRPNIGIRGQNPFRSTKVLFLEDGLPFNFAPYGDNDIYYHPPIERYDGVEIYKGADLTQFGPQTLSGAVNYLTPKVPTKPGGFASFTGGNRDYLNGHVRYGGMFNGVTGVDSAGGTIDYIHKQGSRARDNTFAELDDVNLKSIIDIDAQNRLTLRGDFYREDSQSTFGLTEAEYSNFGPRYNPFKNDRFTTERWAASATHQHYFNDDVTLETSFYWSSFHRDFWRQMNQQPSDLNNCFAGNNAANLAFREARLSGQAIDVDSCNFVRGRLREYETWGVAPTIHAKHDLFGVDNQLDAGFRAHVENQYRRTVDGGLPTARDGVLGEFQDRYAQAFSGFVQNKFMLGDWTATPGVRVESVSYQRENKLNGQKGESSVTEALPSFAMTYTPVDQATLFFGVHRGFAPQRVEDTIGNDGNSVEIGAEKSWNFEFGVRSQPMRGVKSDLTFFHNDFEVLTVLGTVGGNDSPVAQGAALFEGVEFFNRFDLGETFGWNHNPYLQVAYTWLPTAESTSPFQCMSQSNGQPQPQSRCPGGNVYGSEAGKRLPYAPENLLTATLGYSNPGSGFDAHFETVFVDQQFGDFMNLESGSDHPDGPNSVNARSGQFGKISDYVVVNFATSYKIHRDITLYASLKNMPDNDYLVDRVRGMLPGSPRLVQAGFKYEF
ncbi:TonB-dependent receptor [Methylomonas sp. LL1]|uniref:TonB-dependent receptor family protein n=1 Tax=Methylomonas sp. LL1 TaxID=2785785 RepID=UPI0018C3E7C7|nr:TonB-dependent receptor [Methylomonas sp. LL1]QPK62598.1 TonB-dependent receptor [Methylomonas sp. LL1]